MPTQTTTDAFAEELRQRETDALAKAEQVEQALAALPTTQDLKDFVDIAKEAVAELQGKAKTGKPVTGAELAAAHAELEIAELALGGIKSRRKPLENQMEKFGKASDVAEVVRSVISQRVLPGVASYATFAGGGKPDNTPALVVRQIQGSMAATGEGHGVVTIEFHRPSSLYAALDAEQVREALDSAGMKINDVGFNTGVNVTTTSNVDSVTVNVEDVSDPTPLITETVTDVEGWDHELALTYMAGSELVEAQGVGASIVSTDEFENTRTTIVRLTIAAQTVAPPTGNLAVPRSAPGPEEFNLTWLFEEVIDERVKEFKPGVGRCLEAKDVTEVGPMQWQQSGLPARLENTAVLAVELTYISRTS